MHLALEKHTNLYGAIVDIYNYYKPFFVHSNCPLPVESIKHDGNMVQLAATFLINKGLIHIDHNNTVISIAAKLPDRNELLQQIIFFLQNYEQYHNSTFVTASPAIAPSSPRGELKESSDQPLKVRKIIFETPYLPKKEKNDKRKDQTSYVTGSKKAKDSLDESSNQTSPSSSEKNPFVMFSAPRIRMFRCDRDISLFLESMKLVHAYYRENKPKNYRIDAVWDFANLSQFTDGNTIVTRRRMLIFFNRFLSLHGFISQKSIRLTSITALDIEFPTEEKFKEMFESYKNKFGIKSQHSESPAASFLPATCG